MKKCENQPFADHEKYERVITFKILLEPKDNIQVLINKMRSQWVEFVNSVGNPEYKEQSRLFCPLSFIFS
jgi:hypothetical protein